MLVARNLVKSFGPKEAVRGVSFTVRPGEVTGYLGPNGAGKSTTVKMIVGLLAPTEGSVEICGHCIRGNPLDAKRRLGYVPELAALYQTLTPHEYLSLVAELYEVTPGVARERIARLLAAFEIAESADLPMTGFSKGMRQKVLLSSALLHDPDVVIFDEPLSGLDVNAALTLRRIIEGLAARGKTVLYCSHILDVVERLCGRVLVLDQGRIVADAPTAELLASHGRGTLEEVFQKLTRRDGADAQVAACLEAISSASRGESPLLV